MRAITILLACLGVCTVQAVGQSGDEPYQESIENYEKSQVRGFDLFINREMIRDEPDLLKYVLDQLTYDLQVIERMLPEAQLEVLHDVSFWVEKQGATVPGGMRGRGMCFHVSEGWLTEHGLLAQKVNGVEIIRAADFPEWRKNQPYMTFHELAHAYHLYFGYEHPGILAAYENAQDKGLYEAVAYNRSRDGGPVRAYALNNSQEYFAELSEAYWGLNDYFPFTRVQLEAHDPVGFAMVERMWSLTAEELAAGQERAPDIDADSDESQIQEAGH